MIVTPVYRALDLAADWTEKSKDEHLDPSPKRRKKTPKRKTENEDQFSNIPNEVLLRIILPFIPTGEVYHIAPASKGRTSKKTAFWFHSLKSTLISVHHLVRRTTGLPTMGHDGVPTPLTTLSLVSRRMADLTRAVFYGRNQFVFEISHLSLVPHVECDVRTIEPWNRVLNVNPGILRPLTDDTARYLTSLTLCVSLCDKYKGEKQWAHLQDWMQKIANIFVDQPHELKRLTIDFVVGLVEEAHQRCVVTTRLEATASDTAVRMGIKRDKAITDKVFMDGQGRGAQMLEPFKGIRGLREVEVNGAIENEAVESFKDAFLGLASAKALSS